MRFTQPCLPNMQSRFPIEQSHVGYNRKATSIVYNKHHVVYHVTSVGLQTGKVY